jgi:hypothetical protein
MAHGETEFIRSFGRRDNLKTGRINGIKQMSNLLSEREFVTKRREKLLDYDQYSAHIEMSEYDFQSRDRNSCRP